MYINFNNFNVNEEFFSGESVRRYSVESKDKGHIGEIYSLEMQMELALLNGVKEISFRDLERKWI